MVDRFCRVHSVAVRLRFRMCSRAVGQHSVGDMSDEDLLEIEQVACPSAGSCGAQFTANTMADRLPEAIGLALP